MKKIYFWSLLILILIAFLPVRIFAQNTNRGATDSQREPTTHVTAQQAMDIGYAFMHTGTGSRSGGTQSTAVRKQAMQLVYTCRATDTLTRAVTDCYYVFALQPKGFVIVAADERVEPILGYSYDNNFVVENMPEHVRSWLGGYEQQIQTVTKSNAQAEPTIQSKWTRLKSGQSLSTRNGNTVGPLITTQWDQEYPYNTFCPIDNNSPDGHVATGCVATAMAQIINYWGYPIHGRGTHGYNSFYGVLEVDFDNATYDYTNMPTLLSPNSALDEVNAVAKLMYHCGVAVNMEYETEGSGAADVDVRAALVDQFRFSPRMGFADRELYRSTEWIAMLQNELDNGRPVFYGGVSDYNVGTLGHAFICDGYDNNNYFHFNFGWSGNGDGWYLTSSINPGVYDFKSEQAAIMGIEPDSLSNTLYSLLGQMQGGYTQYSVDSVLFFGNELYDNPYKTLTGFGSNVNVVAFYPADTSKQLVLDFMSFSELLYNIDNTSSDDHQYIYIYDGTPQSYTTSEGYTDYMLSDSLMRYYDENEVNSDRSPVVSTKHGLTLVVKNRYRAVQDFHFRISYDDGCRLVSDITTTIDTNYCQLQWHENGESFQWQVEYGTKDFHHGEGVRLTVNDTTAILTGLTPFQEYDIYIRPMCDTMGNSTWNGPVTVIPEAHYWTDMVTSQPEGYDEDSLGNVYISTAEGLAWLAKISPTNEYNCFLQGKKVMLTADINLGRYMWQPIHRFSGVFDGQGHRIDSMYSSSALIEMGRCSENVTIKNISLTNCYGIGGGLVVGGENAYDEVKQLTITRMGANIGGMDTIMNCFVSGRIKGQSGVVAPILDYCYHTYVVNCASNCEIIGEGAQVIGGIAGAGAFDGIMRNCYSASTIIGSSMWNGHVLGNGFWLMQSDGVGGWSSENVVENCYGYYYRAPLAEIAINARTTDLSYFDESDSGFYLLQPIFFEPDNQYYSNLTEALNAGVRKYNLPGLRLWVDDTAGINEGMPILGPEYVVTCPNIQNISARNVVGENGEYGAELSWNETGDAVAWEIEYRAADSLNTVRIITNNRPDTIFGLTLLETYVFRIRPICGTEDYGGWSEAYNHVFDIPYWTDVVVSLPEGYSTDTEGNVIISSAEGLAWLASVVNGLNGQTANDFDGKTVTITQDINIGQYRWKAINGFVGTFDGDGNTISNLYANEEKENQGFFGNISGGTYRNVYLDSAYVKSKRNVGILIGYASDAIIVNCHVNGSVYGLRSVGGLVGYAAGIYSINMCSTTGYVQSELVGAGGLIGDMAGMKQILYDHYRYTYIRNCFSRCNVKSGNFASGGGLIGVDMSCIIENCYATGDVQGSSNSGGLAGVITGTRSHTQNCYAAGTISGFPFGSIAGSIGSDPVSPNYNGPVISNCYGLIDPVFPLMFGKTSDGCTPVISDTASFTGINDSIVLLSSIVVGSNQYDKLLDALNAWVDTYDTAGVFLHWVADTAGINGGFPIFEGIRYNTITLSVADSTPHGTVGGAGTFANYESTIITAIPDYGYHFVQWNDGNTDNPRTIKLTQDTAFSASFEKNMYSVIGNADIRVNYNFDFEDPALDNQWTLQNGGYINRWYITSINEDNKALFISSDFGRSCTYIASKSSVFAYTTLHLIPGEYSYSYTWWNNSHKSHFMVALMPNGTELVENEWPYYTADYQNINILPNEAILLDYYGEQNKWVNGGDYNLVVYYRNEDEEFTAGEPALIDNILFYNNIPIEENSHGYVLGSDTVPYLDTVVLTAVPDDGYSFIQWHDGNTDNPRTVVATADKCLIALFAQCPDTTNLIVYLPESGYEYNGQTYTEEGVYTFSYPVDRGCDSVVNLILCNESLSICNNQLPYTYGDTTFAIGTVSGMYPVISNGQESFLYIQVKPAYSVYDTIITCDGNWEFVGNVCFHDSVSGDYQVVLQSSSGCDSIVNLHYISNPSYWFDLYDTIPRGTEYHADHGFDIPGHMTENIRQMDWYSPWGPTSAGCDSTYVLHLTLTGTPIFYVTENGTGDGSSWTNAMGDLQAALNLAGEVQGDVWVAEGTYYGDGISDNAFTIPEGVYVYGGFVGNEPVDYDLSLRNFAAHPTVLDGQHVQRTVFHDYYNDAPIIDGFIIQNGHGKDLDGYGYGYGGNVFGGTKLQVRNCIIQGGDAMSGEGGGLAYSTIYNSLIIDNTVNYSYGSIMFECKAFNCIIANNNSSEYGYTASVSTLINCVLWGNRGKIGYLCSISYSAMGDGINMWDLILGDGNILLAHSNDGTSPDSNYVRFVDPENGDFHLAYGSACINAGTPDISGLGLPSVDLQGLPRVLDGRIDIGAYEYYAVPEFHTYDTVCEGNSVVFRGAEYAVDGSYTIHANPDPTQDTVYVLHLTVNQGTHNVLDTTVCESFTWTDGTDETYTVSDTYIHAYTNENGCASVDTLYLTVNIPTEGDTTATVCGGFSWYEYSDLTQNGTYTHTLTNAAGCDSVVTLHLTVNTATVGDTIATVCGGFDWYGMHLTQSGDYIHTLTNATGCDSVVTLHLTVNSVYEVTNAQTICASELPYTWNNVQFIEAGTKITTLPTVNGCDSVVTMTLIVNPVYNVTEERIVCAAALPYTWNEVVFTEAGTKITTLRSVNNCDSVVTMILSVNTTYNVTDTKSICFDELPYTWNGVTFTEAGTQSVTLTAANDCDSVVTMTLTVNHSNSGDTTAVVCESFDWYGMHLTQSGEYSHTLTNVTGCDSTVTLHLTVNTPTAGDTTATVCGSFDWHGYTNLTVSGDYTDVLTNAAGCDSTVTLHLTVNTPTEGDTTATVCGSFNWYEYFDLTQTGIYTHTLTNAAGCDSTVTLHLTVNTPTEGDTTASVCGSFDWYEYSGLSQSGDYTHTLTNAAGCDSIVTLHLTVNTPTTGDTSASVCGSFNWYEYSGLTQSGDYTHTLTNVAGCDSIVTLHLTVNVSTEGDTTAVVCGSFDWYEYSDLTQSGDYTHTFTNAAGCDSTVTLHLTVNIPTVGDTTATVCGSFDWYEYSGLTQSGNYTHTLTNAAGCDSTVTLHLTVNTPTEGDTTATVCGSFDWYEYSDLTQSGDYFHTLTNVAGCDSVVTLHLTVNTATVGDTIATVCGGFDWYEYSGLSQSGDYTHTLTNAAGCDSIVNLHLTVNTPTAGDTTATVCGGFSWYEYSDLTQTGIYTHTLTNVAGCDSIVTLHLTVNTPTAGDTTATVCGSFDWYGYSDLTQSGDYTHTLTNSAGCDSTVTLHLTVNTPTAGDTTATVCGSFSWYEYTDLTQSGNYTHTLTNAAGCDSTVTLHLTINTPTEGDTTAIVCGSFSWYEYADLTQSGDYTHTLTNSAGCDSVVTLHLTVNQPTTSINEQTACGSYTWIDGITYTESNNTATYTLTNAAGCDSVVTLNLTINQSVTSTSSATICDSELPYVWNGLTFNEASTQSQTLQTVNGCDSVVTMTLTVNQSATGIDEQEACDSFEWIDGVTYTTSTDLPTYTIESGAATGCDSIVTLHLTINQSASSEFTIVTNESCYVWNGIEYCETGDYTQTLQTADGCDSVVTLHLTIETSISDHSLNANMKVYPNPTSDIVKVELTINNGQSNNVAIQVYDMYGKLLDVVETQCTTSLQQTASPEASNASNTRGATAQTTQFDLSRYANGVYFIKAVSEGNVLAVRKVVKN